MWSTMRQRARALARDGVFTGVSLITLALAVGSSTAVFGVADAVLLGSLPFAEPERLIQVRQTLSGEDRFGMTPADLELLLERVASFEAVGWFREPATLTLTGTDEPEIVRGREVGVGFFDVLGRGAALGRTFTAGEDVAGADGAVVLTHGFWQRRFAGDPGVVGETLVLGDRPRRVVGVLGSEFRFDVESGQDLFLPRVFDPASPNHTGWATERVIGRLARGVGVESANDALAAWAASMEEELPTRRAGMSTVAVPLEELFVGDVAPVVRSLGLAALLLILIVVANLSHLTLARLSTRISELAVRRALGAGRGRILGDQLMEAGLIAAGGVALGALLAAGVLPALIGLSPEQVPGLTTAGVDLRALVVAALVGVGIMTVVGTVPVLAIHGSLGGRAVRGGQTRTSRSRPLVIAGETAVVTTLLLASGLVLLSLIETRAVDPGFDTSEGLAVQITLPADRYRTVGEIQGFTGRLVERLEALPGVTRVGGASTLPLSGHGITISAPIAEGDVPEGPAITRPRTGWDAVTPGYFDALGIPILEGRRFTAEDAEDSIPVIAVNPAFARTVFGDGSPVGRRVGFGSPPTLWMEVVAVVGGVRHDGLRQPARVAFYQFAPETTFAWPTMEVVIRHGPGSAPSEGVIREAVLALDPDQPVTSIRPLNEVWGDSMAEARFQVTLLGIFSAIALALGAVGIYGVVSHSTGLRRREMAVRLALGAEGGALSRGVVVDAGMWLLVGVAVGVAGGIGVGHWLRPLLFGVDPTSPRAVAGVALVLLVTGTAAAYLPARTAARMDPATALADG